MGGGEASLRPVDSGAEDGEGAPAATLVSGGNHTKREPFNPGNWSSHTRSLGRVASLREASR